MECKDLIAKSVKKYGRKWKEAALRFCYDI